MNKTLRALVAGAYICGPITLLGFSAYKISLLNQSIEVNVQCNTDEMKKLENILQSVKEENSPGVIGDARQKYISLVKQRYDTLSSEVENKMKKVRGPLSFYRNIALASIFLFPIGLYVSSRIHPAVKKVVNKWASY